MSILLFGSTGQLGRRLCAQSKEVVGLDRSAFDFARADATTIERLFESYQPTHIINATGYTSVDTAESQPELAHSINAATPKLMAQIAERRGIPFVHFSTDYVFDGAQGPYSETASVNPLSVYGRTKLQGEQAVLDHGATVFRLQWVYDTRGTNFYLTMRRLLAERTQLNVVADQIGAPSFAGHVAAAVLQSSDLPAGLYHMTPQGHTSWHGFATAIAHGIGSNCAIAPITTAEYPTPASRPKDTRLDTSKLASLGITLPHWRQGLEEALHETH